MTPCFGGVFTVLQQLGARQGGRHCGEAGGTAGFSWKRQEGLEQCAGQSRAAPRKGGKGQCAPTDVAVSVGPMCDRQHGRVRGGPFALPQWYLSVSLTLSSVLILKWI